MANKQFGKTLQSLRKNAGFTQQQVADILELKNKSTLASWEIGKSEPDGYTFLKLCKLYQVENIYNAFGYLEVRQEKPLVTPPQQELLDTFDKLPENLQAEVLTYVRVTLAKHQLEDEKARTAFRAAFDGGTSKHVYTQEDMEKILEAIAQENQKK